MPSITLPLDEAVPAFAALLPHTSKDDASEVITAIRSNGATLAATDRYTVGRWGINGGEESEDATFLIPRPVAEWVSKITTTSLRFGKTTGTNGYSVTVEQDENRNVIASIIWDGGPKAERSQMFDAMTDGLRFPLVDRLFPPTDGTDTGAPAREFGFGPAQLEKVTGWAKKYAQRNAPIRFEFRSVENSHKLAPAYFKIGQLDGLIQPNLLLS